ncbi:hypothetical protein BKA56DRAFT_666203 [Ilyonectria sp. MPI-CAGE-AT-0026]|nr:hypothetical protein BKA56DRAFT_666203 [Ilyonectria sp. MPI-CAGE-AT-0026]
MNAAIGFGLRICPGRYFSDSTIFLTVARTLAAFNISEAVDEQGLEIEAKPEAILGIQAELIRAIEIEHPREESHVSLLKGATIDAYSDVLH